LWGGQSCPQPAFSRLGERNSPEVPVSLRPPAPLWPRHREPAAALEAKPSQIRPEIASSGNLPVPSWRTLKEGGPEQMTGLDWSQCPAVESIPGKVSGAWVFRDTRLPVVTVIENLEDLSVEELMEQFDVTREQITAVLEFVAQSLKVSVPPAQDPVPVDAHSF